MFRHGRVVGQGVVAHLRPLTAEAGFAADQRFAIFHLDPQLSNLLAARGPPIQQGLQDQQVPQIQARHGDDQAD